MTPEECNQLIPRVLERNFPGAYQQHDLTPTPIWSIQQQGACIATVDTYNDGRNPHFIRIICAGAILVPNNPMLSSFVNETNEGIFVGNTIMTTGSTGHAVVMRLMVQGIPLSWDYPPTVKGFVDALLLVIAQAQSSSARVLSEFGGRQFSEQEWDVLHSLA